MLRLLTPEEARKCSQKEIDRMQRALDSEDESIQFTRVSLPVVYHREPLSVTVVTIGPKWKPPKGET